MLKFLDKILINPYKLNAWKCFLRGNSKVVSHKLKKIGSVELNSFDGNAYLKIGCQCLNRNGAAFKLRHTNNGNIGTIAIVPMFERVAGQRSN